MNLQRDISIVTGTGFGEMEIQLIDHVKGEKELGEREISGFTNWQPWCPVASTTTDFIIKTRSQELVHTGNKNIYGRMSLVTQF